ADLLNPTGGGVSYCVRLDDARSSNYNSRTNLDGLWAPAGRSEIIIDLRWLPRSGSYTNRLDLAALKLVKIFVGPMKEKTELFFDSVRLEGSSDDAPVDTVLFDFEDDADLASWSQLALDDAKVRGAREPPVRMELSGQNATHGRRSLKLTFSGGTLPTVTTAVIPVADWLHFPTFRADVTVSRDCVVLFRVLRGKSERTGGGRWEKLCRLFPGANEVVEVTYASAGAFPTLGEVVAFDIAMYEPADGESITVDNIRLSDSWPEETTAYRYMNPTVAGGMAYHYAFFPKPDHFKVLGTDWKLSDMDALTGKLKPAWKRPERRTLQEIEAEFTRRYEALKKDHPRAVCVTLREGEAGCDPADPGKPYVGWAEVYLHGHDPAPVYIAAELGARRGSLDRVEMFLRRRAALLRVDLSSIPTGSSILAAQLLLVKADKPREPEEGQPDGPYSVFKPAFLYCEPCNRPWVEAETNGVEYAKGKFWKEIDGMDWRGDDPDFPPLIVACGQAQWDIDTLDFTEAVRYWTDGTHENHGWVMCSPGSAMAYCHIFSHETAEVKNRPALMVVYEPKQ
ncbi:MAG TPA: DNRLRE domain-containing protein, partial [Planctomycetota bacterium]|nr:DNRLRE domain-containing protein [Planctomycetota bacterium]